MLRRRVAPAPLGSNPRGSRGHRAPPYPAGVQTARALRQRVHSLDAARIAQVDLAGTAV